MQVKQIFRIDRKCWTQEHCDTLELFFQNNAFFRDFYQHQDFQQIIAMTFYLKIPQASNVFLEGGNRTQVIILLSGGIQVSKKNHNVQQTIVLKKPNKRIMYHQSASDRNVSDKKTQHKCCYDIMCTEYQQLSTLYTDADCEVLSLQASIKNDNQTGSEILFIPSTLFNAHKRNLAERKKQAIYKGLKQFFSDHRTIQKKALLTLANSQCCTLKEYKIKQYIYRMGSDPENVYLLFEGNVKLEKSGFSAKGLIDMTIISQWAIFGQSDIFSRSRQTSATVCSNFARVLSIQKRLFFAFAREHLQGIECFKKIIQIQGNTQSSITGLPVIPKAKKEQGNKSFNNLYAFQSGKRRRQQRIDHIYSLNKSPDGKNSRRTDSMKLLQNRLVSNCHILIDLSPESRKMPPRSERRQMSYSRRSESQTKDYLKDQLQQKYRLFKKIRPNAREMNLSNRIIDWQLKQRSRVNQSPRNPKQSVQYV